MGNLDLRYICNVIGDLSGIPIRLYENGELVLYRSLVDLPKDPAELYRDEIGAVRQHVGYYITPQFHYYGIVNSERYRIVIGPTRQIPAQEKDVRELAFRLDLMHEAADEFVAAMKSIVPMPLESVMQILCVVNHVLSGEKVKLEDIAIIDAEQDRLKRQFEDEQTVKNFDEAMSELPQSIHNTLALEQTITDIVRRGDAAALREFMDDAPAVRSGILAGNQLRQLKNVFIVTATLVSRSAIRGGMDAEDALTLSDSYIRRCELISSALELTNLQFRMISDYTERVERLRLGKTPTKLAIDVANYVRRHISEPITTQAIADSLYMNRSRLCVKFKADTGVTLNDYILREKTEEAKRLLRYSDKTALAVGSFLGFSSQSHFSNTFKKYTGSTPKEYRDKHGR